MKWPLAILLLVFVGCTSDGPPTATTVNRFDSWYTGVPDTWKFMQAVEIPYSEILEVPAIGMSQAELLLNDTSVLEISDVKATELMGRLVTPPPDGRLFLVRGVLWNAGTGGFGVSCIGSEILVSHGSLGSPYRMKRQALVVPLSVPPTAVHVSCSVAQ